MVKRGVVVFSILLGLCGCMTVGKQFPAPDGAVAIQINKTTQDEIQKTYGTPNMQGLEDGDLTWTYIYLYTGMFEQTQGQQLTVRFNKDGTVHSYSFNSTKSSQSSK